MGRRMGWKVGWAEGWAWCLILPLHCFLAGDTLPNLSLPPFPCPQAFVLPFPDYVSNPC